METSGLISFKSKHKNEWIDYDRAIGDLVITSVRLGGQPVKQDK